MSRRPIEVKKRRRVAKVLRKTPLTAHIDLVSWLIDNKHAKTKREAREVILAKRVSANSHPLGAKERPVFVDSEAIMEPYVDPIVPASIKRDIVVARD